MKITMYELLGLIKDNKAPNKIKYDNIIFEYDGIYYVTEHTYLDKYCDISRCLNDKVEILEEKKTLDKLSTWFSLEKDRENDNVEYANYNFSIIYEKINEICDYLKNKGV